MEDRPLITARINIALLLLLTCIGVRASDAGPAGSDAAVEAWLGDIHLPAGNYVSDGSFEHGGQGWTWFTHKGGGIDTEQAAQGRASFRMGVDDPNRHFYYYQYNIPLETGRTYTVSAMVKTDGITEERRAHGALFLIDDRWTSASIALQAPATKADWTRVSQTFVAPTTKARPDGKPMYHLVVYWPPTSPGQVWLDDVQIEQGDKAGAYDDRYVGDGIVALDDLRTLAKRLFTSMKALAYFPNSTMVDDLTARLDDIRKQAEAIRDDLQSFAKLSRADRENLSARISAAANQLARIRTLIWTGPAHLPLDEVTLPDAAPQTLALTMTCLRGEHRDIALNIAPLEPASYPMKLTPSGLYHRAFALTVPAPQWLDVYTAPLIRGYQRPAGTFTDPLPRLSNAGIFPILPGRINQVILSIDTSDLPPGDYEATIDIDSLLDADSRRTLSIKLKVLPEAILPITDVNIVECFGHTDYAWQAMIELGVNTFDVNTAWIDVTFGESGELENADFTRIDSDVRRALSAVPDAQFVFFSGQNMSKKIGLLTGLERNHPRFERAFKQWVRAIVEHFASLGIDAGRLYMETYDEPGPGDYVAGTAMAQWIEQVEPAVRTWFYASGVVQDQAWKRNALAHDIVGPIVSDCNGDNMDFLAGLGKTLWTYDCAADGETFHPIAYYRLMPWMCRKYGITGWGHFSWFNTSHDRHYKAWQGVEVQNLVYPVADGQGMVLSRRYLAMRAGHEDYRVLDALKRLAARPHHASEVEASVAAACDAALRLAPRVKGYQTHINPEVPAGLLDTLREQVVDRAASLLPARRELTASLVEEPDATRLFVDAPEKGVLRLRYMVAGKLPWRTLHQQVASGRADVPLIGTSERVNRCLVELIGDSGRVYTGSGTIIPLITVDSTSVPYDARNLNDGVCVPAVKFEPATAWISAATAEEHWVEMDFGRERNIGEVRLYWMTYTSLPRKVGLRYPAGEGDWQPVPGLPLWRAAVEPVETIRFPTLRTRKLRVIQAAIGGGEGGPTLMGLSEVEVKEGDR